MNTCIRCNFQSIHDIKFKGGLSCIDGGCDNYRFLCSKCYRQLTKGFSFHESQKYVMKFIDLHDDTEHSSVDVK